MMEGVASICCSIRFDLFQLSLIACICFLLGVFGCVLVFSISGVIL